MIRWFKCGSYKGKYHPPPHFYRGLLHYISFTVHITAYIYRAYLLFSLDTHCQLPICSRNIILKIETLSNSCLLVSLYQMNFKYAQNDKNALFSLKQIFKKETISECRPSFHRACLTREDLVGDRFKYDRPGAPRHQFHLLGLCQLSPSIARP